MLSDGRQYLQGIPEPTYVDFVAATMLGLLTMHPDRGGKGLEVRVHFSTSKMMAKFRIFFPGGLQGFLQGDGQRCQGREGGPTRKTLREDDGEAVHRLQIRKDCADAKHQEGKVKVVCFGTIDNKCGFFFGYLTF